MLQLGLSRMHALVSAGSLPWRAVHVAGTNGKGSVVNSVSRMLRAVGLSVGQFTSPHLLDRWDGISLNGQTISHKLFTSVEDEIKHKDARLSLGSTEFELLTATAFEAFSRAQVDVGVVEVGVGGRLDATNILEDPLATVITAISNDHEALLGDTLEQIATQKAGIIKPGVPCFVAASNPPSVQDVIAAEARSRSARGVEIVSRESLKRAGLVDTPAAARIPHHQLDNLALALAAAQTVLKRRGIYMTDAKLVAPALAGETRGPLQLGAFWGRVDRRERVLLDGAHNAQSAQVLGQYVQHKLRHGSKGPVTWVLAVTKGKDIGGMLNGFVVPGDSVVTTSFGPVDGMPWVEPVAAEELAAQVRATVRDVQVRPVEGVHAALAKAAETADEGPMVVAGSLYLVSDVLRLLRDREENSDKA